VKNGGYDAVSGKSMADIFRAFRVFRGQCVTSVIRLNGKLTLFGVQKSVLNVVRY
jgi:hypothetical protein